MVEGAERVERSTPNSLSTQQGVRRRDRRAINKFLLSQVWEREG
jgi:hypothetical protein